MEISLVFDSARLIDGCINVIDTGVCKGVDLQVFLSEFVLLVMCMCACWFSDKRFCLW